MDAPKLSLPVLGPDLEVGKCFAEVLTLIECEAVWVQMQFSSDVLAQAASSARAFNILVVPLQKDGICLLIKYKAVLLLSVKYLLGRYLRD